MKAFRQCGHGMAGLGRVAAALLLVACMAVALPGCKDSKALVELIPDQSAEWVDYDNPEKVYQEYRGDERDDIVPRELTEAERVMVEAQEIVEHAEQANADEPSPEYEHQDATTDDSPATKGDGAGDDDSEGADPDKRSSDGGAGADDPSDTGGAGGTGDADSPDANAGDADGGGSADDAVGNPDAPVEADAGSESEDVPDEDRSEITTPAATENPHGEEEQPAPPTNPEIPKGNKWDPEGPVDELPQGVSSVAATGQYALMVQMLAGGGTYGGASYATPLAAADEDFLSGKAASVYAREGIGGVKAAWSGDGTESSQLGLGTLLNLAAQGKLQCVLTGSDDSSLSQEQADALYEAGVDVVVMPSLRTDEGITTAVQIVGRLLEDVDTCEKAKGNGTAKEMADEYVRQHDEALADAKEANGGYAVLRRAWDYTSTILFQPGADIDGDSYARFCGAQSTAEQGGTVLTAYFEDWTTTDLFTNNVPNGEFGYRDALTTDYGADCETNGVGLVRSCYQSSPFTYYLQSGGAMNTIFSFNSIPMTVRFLMPKFENYYTSDVDALIPLCVGKSTSLRGHWGYVPHLYLGTGGETYKAGDYPELFSKKGADTLEGRADYYLGGQHSEMPAVIAKDSSIAEKIRRSSRMTDGVYNAFGNEYSVYVMPSGVLESWGEGSPEAFLMAPWAYSMFHNSGDAAQAESYAELFYQTFMRTGYTSAVSDWQTVYACG